MSSQINIKNLKTGSHIHLMGICGTAMASLAGLLKDRGYKVTGSDLAPYPPMSNQIESLGISIKKPYKKENLNPVPDFVIVGNVISANNEEAIEMNNLKLPHCSLPEAMGALIIDQCDSFVVSGTHGKTTTTSLLSWTTDQCGLNPGFLIGGIPKNFSLSFRNPAAKTFVIEGDEYDTAYFDKSPKFIHYKPKNVILTSVEFDHADIYKDFAAVESAFIRLMKLIPESGCLTYCGDDIKVRTVAQQATIKNRFSYGFNAENNFIIKKVKNSLGAETSFEILHNNQSLCGVLNTSMTGDYNILNATAVVVMSWVCKLNMETVKTALKTFSGVKRRQEILGTYGGVEVVEDFAHHPTAVRETILAIQAKYQNRKVFSVFEPRSATSRRKVFQKDYVTAFAEAQEVVLMQPFDQSKINEEDRFSVEELALDLKNLNKKISLFSSVNEIVSYLTKYSQKNDVILIMSNGGFDGIYQKLKDELLKKQA